MRSIAEMISGAFRFPKTVPLFHRASRLPTGMGAFGRVPGVRRRLILKGNAMGWQRVFLGIAILAMSLVMFIPLPLWAAVVLGSVAMLAALGVILYLVLSRPSS